MNWLLWTLQVLLAAMYMWHGTFMPAPPAEMVEMINEQFNVGLRLFLGSVEVLAAVGLILPGITRIMPSLTAWAAAGLVPIMLGASILHLARGEFSSAIMTTVLLCLVTFVAYMRWRVKPLAPNVSLGEVAARSQQ